MRTLMAVCRSESLHHTNQVYAMERNRMKQAVAFMCRNSPIAVPTIRFLLRTNDFRMEQPLPNERLKSPILKITRL